jgi:hypothetical protein
MIAVAAQAAVAVFAEAVGIAAVVIMNLIGTRAGRGGLVAAVCAVPADHATIAGA